MSKITSGRATKAILRTNEQDKAKLAEQDHEGMTMTTDQPTISENPIDLARFSLSACDRVRIEMPPLSDVTEDDIDAQLFAYVANAPKDSPIKTLGDLDDAWVKANLPMYESIGEVRNAIRASLTKETTVAFDEIRYAKCAEALIERLEGDIPVAVIEAHAETVRARTEEAARAQGVSLARYLEDAHMTSEQYEASLLDEARREIALNIALDKMVEVTATTVPNAELTEYLACEDPARFLEELRESGKVEQARKAAARVKVMRRVIETAEVETEGDES